MYLREVQKEVIIMKRNERKIKKTIKLLNEVKDSLTVSELTQLSNSISEYAESRKTPKKTRKNVEKMFSDFSQKVNSFEI